jgi:hypothetical protein
MTQSIPSKFNTTTKNLLPTFQEVISFSKAVLVPIERYVLNSRGWSQTLGVINFLRFPSKPVGSLFFWCSDNLGLGRETTLPHRPKPAQFPLAYMSH